MFGIVTPPPKLAVLYKCRNCGHKFGLLTGFVKKECPCCGGEKLRLTLGTIEKRPLWIVN